MRGTAITICSYPELPNARGITAGQNLSQLRSNHQHTVLSWCCAALFKGKVITGCTQLEMFN